MNALKDNLIVITHLHRDRFTMNLQQLCCTLALYVVLAHELLMVSVIIDSCDYVMLLIDLLSQ